MRVVEESGHGTILLSQIFLSFRPLRQIPRGRGILVLRRSAPCLAWTYIGAGPPLRQRAQVSGDFGCSARLFAVLTSTTGSAARAALRPASGEPPERTARSRCWEFPGPLFWFPAFAAAAIDSPYSTITQKLKTAEFTLKGLSEGHTRVLVLLDFKHKLGKVQGVRGGGPGPIAVRLEPLGTLTGRVLDDGRRPLGGQKVAAFPNLSAKRYEGIPQELQPFGRIYGIGDGAWYDLTARRTVTSADGRFHLDGLLPGIPYTVVAADDVIRPGRAITHHHSVVAVEPGKSKDVGALKHAGADE